MFNFKATQDQLFEHTALETNLVFGVLAKMKTFDDWPLAQVLMIFPNVNGMFSLRDLA